MLILESIKSNKHSLAQQYLYFTVAVISLILIITIWISLSTYHSYQYEKDIFLEKEGQKLQHELDDKLTVVEHILNFLGTKIRLNTDLSESSIAELVLHHHDNFQDDTFSWNSIHFARPDGTLVTDSVRGIIKPIPLDNKKRSWIDKAKKTPWIFTFSDPDLGLSSGDFILPAAVGIYDKVKDIFIGYLTAGISIEKLTTRLLQSSTDEISFIVIDDKLNFIISSEPSLEQKNLQFSEINKNLVLSNKDRDVNQFARPIVANQYIFTHYTHSYRFPFTILIGQNKHYYYQELKEKLLPKVILYIALGVVFTSILLFLGYQVIKPIIELGRAADNISKGRTAIIPHYKATELNTLSMQLAKIEEITKNLRVKQMALGKANQDLEQANSFIKSNMSFLSHELINPISNIIGFSKLLIKKLSTHKDEELKDFADIIHKTSVYQNKQLNFFLKMFKFQEASKNMEEKTIELKEIIEWNVSMIQHHAKRKNVIIKIDVDSGLKLYCDEMMVGQLIQNLASNAAKYNKDYGEIFIKAKKNKKNQISIIFEDTGIGIDKKDLTRIFKKFTRLKNKDTSKSIGYGIGLAYAKECALCHSGNIKVRSILKKGTTFTVTFPSYRTIED